MRDFQRLSLFKFNYAVNPISVCNIRGAKINTEDFKLVCGPTYIYRSGLFTSRGSQPQALNFWALRREPEPHSKILIRLKL